MTKWKTGMLVCMKPGQFYFTGFQPNQNLIDRVGAIENKIHRSTLSVKRDELSYSRTNLKENQCGLLLSGMKLYVEFNNFIYGTFTPRTEIVSMLMILFQEGIYLVVENMIIDIADLPKYT